MAPQQNTSPPKQYHQHALEVVCRASPAKQGGPPACDLLSPWEVIPEDWLFPCSCAKVTFDFALLYSSFSISCIQSQTQRDQSRRPTPLRATHLQTDPPDEVGAVYILRGFIYLHLYKRIHHSAVFTGNLFRAAPRSILLSVILHVCYGTSKDSQWGSPPPSFSCCSFFPFFLFLPSSPSSPSSFPLSHLPPLPPTPLPI